MIIREEKINILNVSDSYVLVSDFSADMKYKTGISKILNEAFNIEDNLNDSLIIIDGDLEDPLDLGQIYEIGNLYMLIVKSNYYDAPDHSYLMESLEELRKQCEFYHIRKLAMPRICTEDNEFEWDDVRQIIEFIFDGSDIEILVCRE